MLIAQIMYGAVHYIWEDNCSVLPEWPPYPDGTIPLLIDITNDAYVEEGWGYDLETGVFDPNYIIPPELIPLPPITLDHIKTDTEIIQRETALTKINTENISNDQLMSMEMAIDTNSKIGLSQEDGLLIMEMLLQMQSQLDALKIQITPSSNV